MLIRKIRKDIEQFIGESRIQAAFTYLWDKLNPESDIYRNFLVIQSTFSLNCNDYRIGTIERSIYILGCAQTASRMLEIAQDLKEVDLLFTSVIKPDDPLASNLVKNSRKAHDHKVEANRLKKSGKLNDCIAEFRKAVELKPHSIAMKTDLAATLRQTHQYNEAIDILKAILVAYPRDTHSRNELASCYREIDALPLAMQTLQDGLKLVETNNHFHTNLFIIHLFFTCNVEFAIVVKKEYTDLTGQELIRDKEVRKKYDMFIHHFEDIHNGFADHELNSSYLGECIYTKKAYQTAVKLLKQLRLIHPNQTMYKNLCQSLPPQYQSDF